MMRARETFETMLAAETRKLRTSPFTTASCGSYTPIFWTRNLDTTKIDASKMGSADPEDPEAWADNLNAKTMPFGAELVVVIRKGGAMQVIKAKQLSDYTFLAGATNDTEAIEVLNAAGTGEDSSLDED